MEEQKQQQGQENKPQEQKFYLNKKVLVILGGIAVVLFVVFIILLQGSGNEEKDLLKPAITPQQNAINPSQSAPRKINPLINPAEVDRVESAFRKKMEESGVSISPKPEYKFQYRLAPELQGKSSFLPVQSVYAAGTIPVCNNIATAPQMVNVYTLRNHVNLNYAKSIASKYGLLGEPYSQPEGTSYTYYFADTGSFQNLEVFEPSAITSWHRIDDEVKKDIGADEAQEKARAALAYHNLQDKVVFKDKWTDNSESGYYVNLYEKNYDNFVMTDKSSILDLGISGDVCGVEGTEYMNKIEARVTKNGNIQKIIETTRKVVNTYSLRRSTPDESIREYKDNLAIDPIVIEPTAIGGSVTTGTVDVDIEKAVLVWYDYGDEFPQTAYIPMYLTSAHLTSDTTKTGPRIMTLFPAVSMQELNKTPIPALSGSRDVIQLYPFNPRPENNNPPPPEYSIPGTPYPTLPGMPIITEFPIPELTVFPGLTRVPYTTGTPGKRIGACYGSKVDYRVTCKYSTGRTACSRFASLPTDKDGKNDPWGVCQNGCQTKSDKILETEVPAGSDPCIVYMKKYGLELNIPSYQRPSYKGGVTQCEVRGCPC